MSVKIKTQENNLLSYDSRVEASKAAVIHKKGDGQKQQVVVGDLQGGQLIFFTALLLAA